MSNVSWKDIFAWFQLTVLLWTYFYVKNLYHIQPLWWNTKLHKFYTIYLILNNEVAYKWYLWPGATKPQKLESLAMIGWLGAGNDLKESVK